MLNRPCCRRGQIILIMSITLIAVILSVSMVIYLTSTQHLFFNYNPSREIILSIDSDFERALTRILANATDFYNKTVTQGGTYLFEIDKARETANKTFSYWVMSTQTVYAGKGLSIETQWVNEPVQRKKTIELCIYNLTKSGEPDKPNYYSFNYSERKLEKLFKLFWYRPNSISVIGADINVDATAQGIIGWRNRRIILLNLTIASIVPYEKDGFLEVGVTVLRENGVPVNDLTAGNFEIYLFDRSSPQGAYPWKRVSVESITYNGGGNYTLMTKEVPSNPYFWSWSWGENRHTPGDYQFIIVRAKDNRGIVVEAYSYPGVEYVIQGVVGTNPLKTKEKYVFELLSNGTMYWYGDKLVCSSPTPPIPFPPVKQFLVEVTENGYTDTLFKEADYQIEAWNDNYEWPISNEFLNYTRRFMNGSKLVFEVNYPPMVDKQKVRITWREDCDFTPQKCNIIMELKNTGEGRIGIVNGTNYVLEVFIERRKTGLVHVDWSLRLLNKNGSWYTDYILPAYDSFYNSTSRTYYIPIKFPDANWTVLPKPINESNRLVSKAPVRLVLYNITNLVITTSPAPYKEIRDELECKQLLYIPYDVWYFQYFVDATWKKSVKINYSYLVFAGMIGGPPDNKYVSQTVQNYKWGSLMVSDTKIINGTFNNVTQPIYHRGDVLGEQPGDEDYSYWTAMYNEKIGAAIFASKQLLDLMEKYGGSYGNRDQLFVWTRGLGASRFMEYDGISLETSSTQINQQNTPSIKFKIAGFLLSGGVADENSKYDNDRDWYDGGGEYARPFSVVNDPGATPTDLVLKKRNALFYEDFSTNPFAEGKLVTNTGAWNWSSNGYIQCSADGPSGSWGGSHVAYYPTYVDGSAVYLLSKLRYSSTTRSHVGFIMSESANRFYTAEFYRDSSNNRRLAIWRYTGTWPSQPNARTSDLSSLSDGTWLIFLGSINFDTRRISITAYDSYGNDLTGASRSYNDPNILNARRPGLQIRDEASGGGSVSAIFDFLIISVDADPGIVKVEGLDRNWRARIEDANGNGLTSWYTADKGVAEIIVRSNPIVRNAYLHIRNGAGATVIKKGFSEIIGGDVYIFLREGSILNAVEECNLYYKMFTGVHIPTIIEIKAAYKTG
ncbi:MAG: hypothetical protein QXF52_02240 [Thermoproteota archaeon]